MITQQELNNVIACTSENYDSSNFTKAKLDEKKNLKSVTSPNLYAPIWADETAFGFRVSKVFGSYVIPNTNFLKIVSPNETVYTNAELVNKKSGKQIFSFRLDVEKNVVDVSFIKVGNYTLILMNESGDRYTEDIMIM